MHPHGRGATYIFELTNRQKGVNTIEKSGGLKKKKKTKHLWSQGALI